MLAHGKEEGEKEATQNGWELYQWISEPVGGVGRCGQNPEPLRAAVSRVERLLCQAVCLHLVPSPHRTLSSPQGRPCVCPFLETRKPRRGEQPCFGQSGTARERPRGPWMQTFSRSHGLPAPAGVGFWHLWCWRAPPSSGLCSDNSARPRPGEGAEGRLETGELAPLGDGLRRAELRWEALGRALRRTQGLGSLYSPQAVFLWPADVGYNFTGYGKQAGSKWLELCGLNSVYSSWLSENWTLVPVGCGPKEVNIGLIPECCFWLIIIPGTAARTPRARAVKRCEPVLSVDQAK